MTRVYVTPRGGRPDYRVVIAFLWSDDHDVDTDGNSHNPASREWTHLYVQNRANEAETVEVFPFSEKPLVLEVEADCPGLAERVAWFLAVETNGLVCHDPAGSFHAPELLLASIGDFDVEAARRRADASRFRASTLANPYP